LRGSPVELARRVVTDQDEEVRCRPPPTPPTNRGSARALSCLVMENKKASADCRASAAVRRVRAMVIFKYRSI
jgi:hypothetical protein